MTERRWKRGFVTEQFLVQWFRQYRGTPFVAVPLILEMPEDVAVERVFYSMEYAALTVILSHPSWPIVKEGYEIPILAATLQVVLELRETEKLKEE